MNPRQRLVNDTYLAGLKRRSELAFEWFDAIAKVLQNVIHVHGADEAVEF